ncbi:enolase C-terminal domain-like protein [Mycobacterium sp. ACS4331]|uniref:enolase C-terminal domain-like protein n=1 Tax=Mycobacterium sp. ACS4331 TaxID=1834121 RepID=UPI0007FDD2D8|nr:enolase C-terminal domain-like protein [Mycobacterium sp. ACS4331]OBF11339.1 O-succinylbenzoate synthase [Mycobacterium sp. ACS4331]
MRTFIDFDDAPVFAIPRVDGSVYSGVLIEGPQGWGEFGPGPDADLETAVRWLTAAVEPGTVGWPDPRRGRIPVALSVPAGGPEQARRLVAQSGCVAADVTVAAHPGALREDLATVAAVREALGPGGAIRVDAGGRWDLDAAVAAIPELDRAAGGLEFVAQPCSDLTQTARVRATVGVRIAVPVTARTATAELADSADVLVLSTGPLGGVRRALRVAERCGLPAVVTSAGETTIGLSSGLALAGALPELPFACALDGVSRLRGDVVPGSRSLIPSDGHLPVAPMPPAPDREALERFAVADAATVARWRGLVSAALTRL